MDDGDDPKNMFGLTDGKKNELILVVVYIVLLPLSAILWIYDLFQKEDDE